MRLFLNPAEKAYLRELSSELNASPSQVKDELHQLSEAGFLTSNKQGRQINFQANIKHPLYPELHSMVRKALGMDQILESIIERLGNLESAYLIDDYACGKDTGIIDLMLIGNINKTKLDDVVQKTEKYIDRKIRTLILTVEEYEKLKSKMNNRPKLLLWQSKFI